MSLAFEKYFLTHRKLLPLPRRRNKTLIERKQLFATAEKVWSLSSTRRESSSSQNRKHSHTHTLTHSLTHSHHIYAHTQDDCYTLATRLYGTPFVTKFSILMMSHYKLRTSHCKLRMSHSNLIMSHCKAIITLAAAGE